MRFWTFASCQCQGRVFKFSREDGKLTVIETLLGDEVKFSIVKTDLNPGALHDNHLSCCALGDRMLLLAGSMPSDVFAYLVDVDEGELTESSLHITPLAVSGAKAWPAYGFLQQITTSQALLTFAVSSGMWRCCVDESALTMEMTKLPATVPDRQGFMSLPTLLPDGNYLVVGSGEGSRNITKFSLGDKIKFKTVGKIPGLPRHSVPTILVEGRFLIGFGGWSKVRDSSDLWVFDTVTGKTTDIKQEGNWHPADFHSILAVKNGVLYILSGLNTNAVHAIPLSLVLPAVEASKSKSRT